MASLEGANTAPEGSHSARKDEAGVSGIGSPPPPPVKSDWEELVPTKKVRGAVNKRLTKVTKPAAQEIEPESPSESSEDGKEEEEEPQHKMSYTSITYTATQARLVCTFWH